MCATKRQQHNLQSDPRFDDKYRCPLGRDWINCRQQSRAQQPFTWTVQTVAQQQIKSHLETINQQHCDPVRKTDESGFHSFITYLKEKILWQPMSPEDGF